MYANVVIVRFLQFPQTPRKKGGMFSVAKRWKKQKEDKVLIICLWTGKIAHLLWMNRRKSTNYFTVNRNFSLICFFQVNKEKKTK